MNWNWFTLYTHDNYSDNDESVGKKHISFVIGDYSKACRTEKSNYRLSIERTCMWIEMWNLFVKAWPRY